MNDGADQYLISAMATRDVPRLILIPRENFQFVFEDLARQQVTKSQFPSPPPKSLDFRDPQYMLGFKASFKAATLVPMNSRMPVVCYLVAGFVF